MAVLTVSAGCPRPTSDDAPQDKLPLEGVKLTLAIVDDPALAAAVRKTEGEWRTQTGSMMDVVETTEDAVLAQTAPTADALIGPAYLLGLLAERDGLATIPDSLRGEGQEDWNGLFELARSHEAAWGSSTILGVPFGSPVLVCYYRADLLKQLRKSPPQTWDEYQELAALLADRANLGDAAPPADAPWSGAMEPLGPGWAGLVLMARAASGVKHPDNYSTWFKVDTMEPLINGPPVVRALVQMVTAAKYGSATQFEADPDDVRAAFWRGECGLALTWPTAAVPLDAETEAVGSKIAAGVVELPGSREHFNIDERAWQKRDSGDEVGVPLLATSGRMGVVFDRGDHPAASAQLLLWLSALSTDPPLSARSPWTTLYRRGQTSLSENWVEKPMNQAVADEYAKQTEATFERQQWAFALRIPGRQEYLAALDEAVLAALRGESPPAAALYQAAEKWRETTQRLGVQQQRTAYQRSLGLEP
ncbi:MAG: extracellular solute-binding protein [Pirellulaceae bacterium]|nr:extracellular solute-binding protein [Pirellulaceae bacterium]